MSFAPREYLRHIADEAAFLEDPTLQRACVRSFEIIGEYIRQQPYYRRDLHEVKAIAIELLVGRRLKLGLNQRDVVWAGRKNAELLKNKPVSYFERLVRRAQRNPHIHYRADIIMAFIDKCRKQHQW
jgi:hypothetical protein